MQNPNSIEEIHVNLDMMRGLGLMEDPDVIEALNLGAGEDFSVMVNDEDVLIFGNTVDETEYEDIGLHLTTERGLGYYASRFPILPADLMM